MDFAKVKQFFSKPDFKNNILIAGYAACPFSQRAQDCLNEHNFKEDKKQSFSFKPLSFVDTARLKRGGYSGTFPLVFVKDKCTFRYIGGSDDLIEYLEKLKE